MCSHFFTTQSKAWPDTAAPSARPSSLWEPAAPLAVPPPETTTMLSTARTTASSPPTDPRWPHRLSQTGEFLCVYFAGIGLLLHDRNEISRITGDERKSKPLLDASIAKEQYHQSRSTRQRGRARGVLSTDKQKAICIFGLEFSVEARLVLIPQFSPNRCAMIPGGKDVCSSSLKAR